MTMEDMRAAIGAVRNADALDGIARAMWAALASGTVSEAEAEAIGAAIEARRHAVTSPRRQIAVRLARPRPQRSPDRARSIARRRQVAAAGWMPPPIAALFTEGERAALSVVAATVARSGSCAMPLDQVAALAGVSRSTAKNAVRRARALGLVTVTERRRPGAKNLPNVVAIVDAAWCAWLRLGHRGQIATHHVTETILLGRSNRRVGRAKPKISHLPLAQSVTDGYT